MKFSNNKKEIKKIAEMTNSQCLIIPEVKFKYMSLEWCVQSWEWLRFPHKEGSNGGPGQSTRKYWHFTLGKLEAAEKRGQEEADSESEA